MEVSAEEMEDPEVAAAVAAYGQWSETITAWRNTGPVVVDAIANGAQLARLASDTSADPLYWVGELVDPEDPSTFTPRPLSEIDDADVLLGLAAEHPTVMDWYASEVDPALAV